MDISAHALRLFDLSSDPFVAEVLGSRRFDRDALAKVCLGCENLQWG
jgi:hypothetical protein